MMSMEQHTSWGKWLTSQQMVARLQGNSCGFLQGYCKILIYCTIYNLLESLS